MTGRVLSNEEIKTFVPANVQEMDLLKTIQEHQRAHDNLHKIGHRYLDKIDELKKQITEREKTIAELQDSTHYAIGRAVHRLQQQNTILREALEYEIKHCYACRGTGILTHMRGYDFPCTECANARESMAKLEDLPRERTTDNA